MGIVSSKPTITRKELEGVLDCLIAEQLRSGNIVKAFEQQLGEVLGIKHCCALSSLTSAYHLAFCALEIKAGDEVIIPSYFDAAPLAALGLTGARAVLADVDDGSLSPSVDQIREKISPATRAVVIGHTFGFHCRIEELRELSVPIIEDISHALGTEIDEKPAGQGGEIAVASFAPSMMITTGNGAAILTNNSRHFALIRRLRGGAESGGQIGYDYGMTDFQAAMGLSQTSRVRDFIRRRREIARVYYEAVKSTPHKTPLAYDDSFSYQSFPILFDAPAERVEKYWKKADVEIVKPIPVPLHGLMGMPSMVCPRSERLSKKLHTLPLYPTLTKKEIEKIASLLAKFV